MGVKIRCIDPFQPRARPQKFDKLVRNLIPLRIVSRGEAARIQRVSAMSLVRLLKAKSVEEALELNAEEDPERTLEELADGLEVILTICELYEHNFEELRKLAEKKRTDRGGFEKGMVLVQTEEVPLIPTEATGLFPTSGGDSITGRIIETQGGGDLAGNPKKVHNTTRGITISLVPPPAGLGNRNFMAPIRGTGLEAVIEYGEKDITLVVRPVTAREDDRRQLLLPFS